jgi:hypothetical protein
VYRRIPILSTISNIMGLILWARLQLSNLPQTKECLEQAITYNSESLLVELVVRFQTNSKDKKFLSTPLLEIVDQQPQARLSKVLMIKIVNLFSYKRTIEVVNQTV